MFGVQKEDQNDHVLYSTFSIVAVKPMTAVGLRWRPICGPVEIALAHSGEIGYSPPMRKYFFVLIFAPLFSGCILDDQRFGMPNLFHPGHIDEQRAKMAQFDPFPQVGTGPTIEGGRFHGADMPKRPVEQRLR